MIILANFLYVLCVCLFEKKSFNPKSFGNWNQKIVLLKSHALCFLSFMLIIYFCHHSLHLICNLHVCNAYTINVLVFVSNKKKHFKLNECENRLFFFIYPYDDSNNKFNWGKFNTLEKSRSGTVCCSELCTAWKRPRICYHIARLSWKQK